jgi:hypothetical protein
MGHTILSHCRQWHGVFLYCMWSILGHIRARVYGGQIVFDDVREPFHETQGQWEQDMHSLVNTPLVLYMASSVSNNEFEQNRAKWYSCSKIVTVTRRTVCGLSCVIYVGRLVFEDVIGPFSATSGLFGLFYYTCSMMSLLIQWYIWDVVDNIFAVNTDRHYQFVVMLITYIRTLQKYITVIVRQQA